MTIIIDHSCFPLLDTLYLVNKVMEPGSSDAAATREGVPAGHQVAPVTTTVGNGDAGSGAPTIYAAQENGNTASGSASSQHANGGDAGGHPADNNRDANKGNGETAVSAGKEDNGDGKEHGEINGEADGTKKDGGAGDDDMEIEPPPKEDPMVDYTDEFGRIRTMRQRSVS